MPLGLRYGVAKLACCFEPEVHGLVDLLQRSLLRATVGHASREFGCFSDKDAVFIAPVDDDLVLVHVSLAA